MTPLTNTPCLSCVQGVCAALVPVDRFKRISDALKGRGPGGPDPRIAECVAVGSAACHTPR